MKLKLSTKVVKSGNSCHIYLPKIYEGMTVTEVTLKGGDADGTTDDQYPTP